MAAWTVRLSRFWEDSAQSAASFDGDARPKRPRPAAPFGPKRGRGGASCSKKRALACLPRWTCGAGGGQTLSEPLITQPASRPAAAHPLNVSRRPLVLHGAPGLRPNLVDSFVRTDDRRFLNIAGSEALERLASVGRVQHGPPRVLLSRVALPPLRRRSLRLALGRLELVDVALDAHQELNHLVQAILDGERGQRNASLRPRRPVGGPRHGCSPPRQLQLQNARGLHASVETSDGSILPDIDTSGEGFLEKGQESDSCFRLHNHIAQLGLAGLNDYSCTTQAPFCPPRARNPRTPSFRPMWTLVGVSSWRRKIAPSRDASRATAARSAHGVVLHTLKP